jgi:hypothetical protein
MLELIAMLLIASVVLWNVRRIRQQAREREKRMAELFARLTDATRPPPAEVGPPYVEYTFVPGQPPPVPPPASWTEVRRQEHFQRIAPIERARENPRVAEAMLNGAESRRRREDDGSTNLMAIIQSSVPDSTGYSGDVHGAEFAGGESGGGGGGAEW